MQRASCTKSAPTLAREGMRFLNAFATTPLCSPSRASLLTGQYARTHGIIDNTARPSHDLPTFPRELRRAGYATGFFGKWHMGNDDSPRPGFTHWVAMPGQGEAIDPQLNVDGQQVSLVSLGISNTREGTLTLDSARLEKTLAANPGALDALFKGTGGTDKGILGSLLDRESGLAKYTSSVNGILKNRKDSIADSLKRVEKERERVDTQYDNLYQRYLKQYTNLVTIMSQMEQTSGLYFT